MKFYNKAIDIDQEFALSYTGLANVNISLGFFGLRPPKDVFPKAKSLCKRAIEIDKNLASAHWSLSTVSLYYDWDWAGADKGYKKAIELNPGDAFSYWRYANYLGFMGRFDEALREIKKALNLDPLSPLFNSDIGVIYGFCRRYDEAMKWYHKSLEIDPHYGFAFHLMGITLTVQGKYKEAEKNIRSQSDLPEAFPIQLAGSVMSIPN
jgi:serine/threonine-protein kinase